MELKNMFPNLNGAWIRWSDYRIFEDKQGMKYIMPADTATSVMYSCTDVPEQMVVDALNVGKIVFEDQDNATDACLSFARKYGPLVVQPRSKQLDQWTDKRYHESKDIDTGSLFNNGIFAKSYGELVDWYQYRMRLLYLHFLLANGQTVEMSEEDKKDLLKQEETFEACGMNCRLTTGAQPQLIWEPESLLHVLKLSYALLITDPANPLKICKHCREAYYNPNSRSEFCSVKCRNHYNVKVFRERQKEQE